MQYPIIDLLARAYYKNNWSGFEFENLIQFIIPNINGEFGKSGGIIDYSINNGFTFTVNRTSDDYIGAITFDNSVCINGIYATVLPNTTYTLFNLDNINFRKNFYQELDSNFIRIGDYVSIGNIIRRVFTTSNTTKYITFRFGANNIYIPGTYYTTKFVLLEGDIQTTEYIYKSIYDDIANRLKLPLPHYFPHPVIDALKRASDGTMTNKDREILTHYLTPLGIGGI